MNRWHPLPAAIYRLVEETPAAVLLESAQSRIASPSSAAQVAPLSRLFIAPARICAAYERHEIPGLIAAIECAVASGLFAAGFLSYECGQSFEPKAFMQPGLPGEPLAWFGIYERSWPFDHDAGCFTEGEPPGLERTHAEDGDPIKEGSPELQAAPRIEAEFAFAEVQYAERVAEIQEWIRAGDIYQLNFTAPYRLRALENPAALYAHLRSRQPVEYGAFIHWQQDRQILSFSPELFFRIEPEGAGRRITSRPMKGTAARGRTTGEDRARAEWLRSDAKNRAENLMIVDLVRNDLGRLCSFGSVKVEDLFAVERYPSVWQMTSTVTGELRPGAGLYEIFRALFPCGSVTGAPKVRAMQLAARVEDGPRGVYTGAIGYISAARTVFNVAIRTIELDRGRGTMGVGSGIVIDSAAREEFNECQLKARFLTEPASRWPVRFSLIESLLWRGGDPFPASYPFLDLHLNRLEDSADYFGFACDRAGVREALRRHAEELGSVEPRKVRLLLDCDGEFRIASEILNASLDDGRMARVRVAAERTDPRDPMLFHKTTHRPLYIETFQAASAAGFDDVLFLNERNEVTEGAISNVFIEKGGRWSTPPIDCGLLAGVYRRHLLATRGEIEERVLYWDDLRNADAVYIANAVRGLRHAAIVWDD